MNLGKNSAMKVALFIPDLRGGGVERVRLLLAREFIAKGHTVHLVLLRKQGVLLDQVPAEVRVIDLQAGRVRGGFVPLVRYLCEHRPDALLASMWPLTTLAVLAAKVARFRGRVVVSEHNALTRSARGHRIRAVNLRVSMRWINSAADTVIGVSRGVVDDLHALGLPKEAGKVIYNPTTLSATFVLPTAWSEHPWFTCARAHRLIAVGSLKEQKDYPTLLAAVKKVRDSGTAVSLLILGTGPLQSDLEEQRRALGLEDHVHFGGFVTDPGPFYRAAGLFVLSSAWEGFGNVIVEALAAGTPVVSTDCCYGPAEILANGRYGRLVPVGDDTALAEAICHSLVANHDLDALRARAADFKPEKIGKEYLKVLTPRGSV
jgi:glycosyltransferase involved in cell wall biosynthesis